MLERENKALREARQDALAEADRARAQLAVSTHSLSSTQNGFNL